MAPDVMEEASTHCERGELVGEFGIIIQGILGAIAFSTLMLKRLKEPKKTRRSWTIWFYDTSKQGFGALFIHMANIYLAYALTVDDPCTFYLISFLLDSTVGLFLIYIGLKLCQRVVTYFQWTPLYFGEYGNPPKCNAWIGQCTIYLFVMIIEKILVGLLVMPEFWKDVRKYMLSWIKNPHVEVILVMLIIPFIVNTLMFWVIDSILMKKNKKFHSSGEVFVTSYSKENSEIKIKRIPIKNFNNSTYHRTSKSHSETTSLRGDKNNHSVRYQKLNAEKMRSNYDLKTPHKNEETMLLLHEEADQNSLSDSPDEKLGIGDALPKVITRTIL